VRSQRVATLSYGLRIDQIRLIHEPAHGAAGLLVADDPQRLAASLPLVRHLVVVAGPLRSAGAEHTRALGQGVEDLLPCEPRRDDLQHVELVGQHRVPVRVEQRRHERVAAARIADEEAEGAGVGKRDVALIDEPLGCLTQSVELLGAALLRPDPELIGHRRHASFRNTRGV